MCNHVDMCSCIHKLCGMFCDIDKVRKQVEIMGTSGDLFPSPCELFNLCTTCKHVRCLLQLCFASSAVVDTFISHDWVVGHILHAVPQRLRMLVYIIRKRVFHV